jgi:hypothetical protein
MRTLFFSLLVGLITTASVAAQEIKSDFELEGVHFEKCKTSKNWCLVLDAKGVYERMDYPKLKFFINDKLVADTDQLYGIVLDNGYTIETDLKEVPEDFEFLIVVTAMNRSKGDCFIFQSEERKKPKEVEEEYFDLETVSLMGEEGKKFIRLNFKPFTKDDFYWAYPLFKVEIDGKVVAERDLQTYGMTQVELIPTKLKELPKHFKMKVTIGMHNSKQQTIVEYKQ